MAAGEAGEKYDLSKEAYVLVVHHLEFEDSTPNRDGSAEDLEKIKLILSKYRTKPDVLDIHENLSLSAVRVKMDKIYKKDFSAYSCLIVIIMSHGGEADSILAKNENEKYMLEEDVVEKVALNQTLGGKPKIFIVNACRGSKKVEVDSAVKRVRYNNSDIILFQSTFPGHVSYRDTYKGSFFVQTFFKLLNKNDKRDIWELNRKLNKLQTDKKEEIQNPTMTQTLAKRLIFADLRKKSISEPILQRDVPTRNATSPDRRPHSI